MAKKIVVIFEEDTFQVVYGKISGKNLVIEKTLSFKKEEFDGFLQKERNREFAVVYNFKTFYSEIVHLPPVKSVKVKYFKKILESEIKKKFHELKDFSFIHTVLGERIFQGKKKIEVFIFAVNNEEIETVTNRFAKYGKRITHFIPGEFSFAQAVEFSEEPVLCVTKSGINKTMFLLKDGKIIFVRVARGIDSGIHDFDVQNINMTINYCRQTLKINPALLILLGKAGFEYDAQTAPIAPLICLDYRTPVLGSKKTIIEFMSGIAFLSAERQSRAFLKEKNILPLKYKIFYTIKKALSSSAVLFFVLLICGIGYVAFQILNMEEIKRKIENERASMENIESVISVYREKKSRLQKFLPVLNTTNRLNSRTSSQKLMIELSNLNINNIEINNILITPEEESIKLNLEGVVDAASFNETQISYQNFIDSLKKIEGMEVSSYEMNIKKKAINVEARYND